MLKIAPGTRAKSSVSGDFDENAVILGMFTKEYLC